MNSSNSRLVPPRSGGAGSPRRLAVALREYDLIFRPEGQGRAPILGLKGGQELTVWRPQQPCFAAKYGRARVSPVWFAPVPPAAPARSSLALCRHSRWLRPGVGRRD